MSNTGTLFFDLALIAYLLSGVGYLVAVAVRSKWLSRAAMGVQVVGLLCGAAYFVQGWVDTGYPPLRNLHESLVLTANLLVVWNLVQSLVKRVAFLGPLSGFAGGLFYAWAGSFGTIEKHTVPALQSSFWLTSHVFLCMLAYVAVLIATVAALFLLMRRGFKSRMAGTFTFSVLVAGTLSVIAVKLLQMSGTVVFASITETGLYSVAGAFVGGSLLMPLFYYAFSRWGLYASVSRDNALEHFVHTTALIGLALITLGIITGSIWGDIAWGRYWGWDPKEVWALLTWFALLIYIHLRSCGKRGSDLAPWAIVIGLVTVVFNYFGVNFVLTGLHTYAG